MKPDAEREDFISITELVEHSGMARRTLEKWLHDPINPIPHRKVGTRVLILVSEFREWVDRRKVKPKPIDVSAIVDNVLRPGGAHRLNLVMLTMAEQRCLFCGGDASEPNHRAHCDGRQGGVEPEPDFDGETYERERDHERLHRQLSAVQAFMGDGAWHTLNAIAEATGHPPASVSARLRDLRKAKFGGFNVERRYVLRGLFEYRLLLPVETLP